MLRTALALALLLATAANAAQSLGVPPELAPQLELEPKNSRQGVSENSDGGTEARAPSTQECDCEIFVVAPGLAVVQVEDSFSLYAFAGFDPINRRDPLGLTGCGSQTSSPQCALVLKELGEGGVAATSGSSGAGATAMTGLQGTGAAGVESATATAEVAGGVVVGPATLIPAAAGSGLSTFELFKLSVMIGLGFYKNDVTDPIKPPDVTDPVIAPPVTDPKPAGTPTGPVGDPKGPATVIGDPLRSNAGVEAAGRRTNNIQKIFEQLEKYHGIPPELASERLHKIKEEHGMRPDDNPYFDFTGNVYNPITGEKIGSLTEGGAKAPDPRRAAVKLSGVAGPDPIPANRGGLPPTRKRSNLSLGGR